MSRGRFRTWELVTVIALIAALVVGYLLAVVLAPDGATFEGTDATVGAMLPAEPWAEPLFSPASYGPEVEAGLFAIQAAVGGVVLGFLLGRLTRRVPPDATEE
ncbi:energy-coupling factor ABC transporter substrate-binding protein [Tessaracoccus sp. Y36]